MLLPDIDWHGVLRSKYASRHPMPFNESALLDKVRRHTGEHYGAIGREFYELARSFAFGLPLDVPEEVLLPTLARLHELDCELRLFEGLLKD